MKSMKKLSIVGFAVGLFLVIFGTMTICWATVKYPDDTPILELLVTIGACFMISISVFNYNK